MKHLPNELLYLLKVYNYIKDEVGLDHARSREDDIRDYIAKADYLSLYPGVLEYLSPDKSISDIITYIQRNERTYALLGEWKDREMTSILESIGVRGDVSFTGNFSIKKCDNDNAYFTLPLEDCIDGKIILHSCNLTDDVVIKSVLWLELYRTREGYCIEIFDEELNTFKAEFSDITCEPVFLSALPLCSEKSNFESSLKMARHIYKKHKTSPDALSEGEKELLPVIRFLAHLDKGKLKGSYPETEKLFADLGIAKATKLFEMISNCDDKKLTSAANKLRSLLKSRKCRTLTKKLCGDIKKTQESLPENIL